MSQVLVRFGSKLTLLIFLSLCVGNPWSATCQSGDPGASVDPAKRSTAVSDIGAQTTSREAPGGKSKNGSFILSDVEPLLLLLFGSLLFSVATGIKLRLARVNRASSQ